jgi:O-antigen/teichoic acid export membrane protein
MLSAAGLLTGLGNYAFQAIIGRHLERGEYGFVNTTLSLMGLLSLPMLIASTAVTHYIARYDATGDAARLEGLLAGCRRFLFLLTLAGSVMAAALVAPLSDFFHFPRTSLALVALGCVLGGLWGSFATALCQGLAWFKRMALIGVLAMVLRLAFGGMMTREFPIAEVAVAASGVAMLANLALLFWRKDLARRGPGVSPWNPDLAQFFVVSAACIGGGYCFTQSDLLVAQRYFSPAELGTYSAAGLLARALPMVVAPLLTVLFTHRSGQSAGSALREQLKLLGLYATGLIAGALCLLLARGFFVKMIFGHAAPESTAMIGRLALTMVCVGLLQALGLWALASRWMKLAVLYGLLGLGYWLALLYLGTSPPLLLRAMPCSAALALVGLFLVWALAVRASMAGERATAPSVRAQGPDEQALLTGDRK